MGAGLAQWWERSPSTNVSGLAVIIKWAEFVGSVMGRFPVQRDLRKVSNVTTNTKQVFDV